MLSVSELKKDLVIIYRGALHKILDAQHTKLGRGGGFVRTKLRNMSEGSVIRATFKGNESIEPVSLRRIDMQYLYRDGDNIVLMDLATYEQTTTPAAVASSRIKIVPEGSNVIALEFNNKIIDIELPKKLVVR